MWERLREKRSQKERESGLLGRSSPSRPASGASPSSEASNGASADDPKQKLRDALDAFRKQQEASRPGARPAADGPPDPEDDPSLDGAPLPPLKSKKEIQEALEYLDEVLEDYGRFVMNIGENGVAAPMVLYYRDEVQDLLDELTTASAEISAHWLRTVELDDEVRRRAQALVDEIGWANFKQYQIINDPPRQNWWWYLNRETRAPAPPPPFWQFWKQ